MDPKYLIITILLKSKQTIPQNPSSLPSNTINLRKIFIQQTLIPCFCPQFRLIFKIFIKFEFIVVPKKFIFFLIPFYIWIGMVAWMRSGHIIEPFIILHFPNPSIKYSQIRPLYTHILTTITTTTIFFSSCRRPRLNLL